MSKAGRYFDLSRVPELGQQGLKAVQPDEPQVSLQEQQEQTKVPRPKEKPEPLADNPCVEISHSPLALVQFELNDGDIVLLSYFDLSGKLPTKAELVLLFRDKQVTIKGRNLDKMLTAIQQNRVSKMASKDESMTVPQVAETDLWINVIAVEDRDDENT